MVTTRNKSKAGESVDGEQIDAQSSPETQKKNGQKLPVRRKDDEETKGSATTTSAKGTLVVFDDQEDGTNTSASVNDKIAKPKSITADQEDQEDSESDDDAPEAVSTTRAASDIKQSAKVSNKVVQEQAATQKRKRQERDNLFKQQAEERKKAGAVSAVSANDKLSSGAVSSSSNNKVADVASSSVPGRRRGEKIQFPDILPAEFLTDSSSEDEDNVDGARQLSPGSGSRKRRKVSGVERGISRKDKGSRDVTLGSTTYRVAKKVDERLAPKAKKHAIGSKDALLRRSRAPVQAKMGSLKRR